MPATTAAPSAATLRNSEMLSQKLLPSVSKRPFILGLDDCRLSTVNCRRRLPRVPEPGPPSSGVRIHALDRRWRSPGMPSAGGVNTVEALNVLEAAGFPARGGYGEDAQSLFWFMQIHRLSVLGALTAEERAFLLPGVDL